MKISSMLITTGIAEPGMTVREVFQLCAQAGVQALPYRHRKGAPPEGLVSIDRVLKNICLPDYMVALAPVLGDSLSCLDDAGSKVHEILSTLVDEHTYTPIHSITSKVPVLKALALMQKYETSYLFVIDDNEYRGVVTNVSIAARMIEFEKENTSLPPDKP